MEDIGSVIPAHGDPATVRAIGHLAAFLLTMLHRNGLLEIGEVGDHLALYACLTGETDPEAGIPLTYWASMVRDTAEDLRAG